MCCEGCAAHRPFEILCSVAAPSNLLLSACLSHTFEISEGSGRLHHNAFCSNALNAGLYNIPLPPPQVEGVDSVFQDILNKIMHIQNGNTTLRLQKTEEGVAGFVQLNLCQLISPSPDSLTYLPQYSRNKLLQYRPTKISIDPEALHLPTLTTTQFQGSAFKAEAIARTGRRIRVRHSNGQHSHFKARPSKRQFRIRELGREFTCRTPPPRGAPGAPFGAYKECPPQKEAPVVSRGALKRRLFRRAYRKWRRRYIQECCNGVGSHPAASLPPKKAAQSRAKWFKQTLHWQEHHRRKKKGIPANYPTTTPLDSDSRSRMGSLNVQGFADTLKLKNSIQMMREHNLGVLFLSETKSTSYYSYNSEGHLVVLSGNNREKRAGVGVIIAPKLRPYLLDIIQVSPRLIHVTFKKKGGNVHLIGTYAPHSGHDLDEVRQPFWDQIEEHITKIPQPEPVYITGDFNVRFQGRHPNDEGVLGKFVYGKGKKAIDHNASSNRSLCIQWMKLNDLVEVASFRTPNMLQQITYRDKAAPPKDWSQFLLDPLILQQVYDKLHYSIGEASIEVAANVRSFLECPEMLPPPQITPQVDPVRFQRLDHTFTRKQWLNSVRSCKSKLHMGFPSDHYLLVTEVQVKLVARQSKAPRPIPLNLKQPSSQDKEQYNSILRELIEEGPILPVTTTPSRPDFTVEYYTDGSGSRGKCTQHTPAGWGWTCKTEEGWQDAHGPVVTDPLHRDYHGATVGSNNTGEVTAIVEALLHAHSLEATKVLIRSDSMWAINVITGRWRAKHHKKLVGLARSLTTTPHLKVHFHWVKGHAGAEGNERADKLADKGKAAQQKHGTSAGVPEITNAVATSRAGQGWTDAMHEAAKQTFRKAKTIRAKPWISDLTLEALTSARKAEAEGVPEAKTKRNKAKRLARKDKIKWVHDLNLQATRREKRTRCGKQYADNAWASEKRSSI